MICSRIFIVYIVLSLSPLYGMDLLDVIFFQQGRRRYTPVPKPTDSWYLGAYNVCEKQKYTVLKTLVEKRITEKKDLDEPGEYDASPLYYAATYDWLDIAQLLVENGASIHNNNQLLHTAAQNDSYNVAQYLIEQGAAISTQDDLDRTPLATACKWGGMNGLKSNWHTIALLLKKGAKTNVLDRWGYSALMLLCEADFREEPLRIKIAKRLLYHDADLTLVNQHKENAALIARKKNLPMLASFIEHYLQHKEFIFDAIKKNNGPDLKKSIKQGTLRIKDEHGNTPLHVAFMQEKPNCDIIQLIIYADPLQLNEKNRYNQTPLQSLYSESLSRQKIDVLFIIAGTPYQNACIQKEMGHLFDGTNYPVNTIYLCPDAYPIQQQWSPQQSEDLHRKIITQLYAYKDDKEHNWYLPYGSHWPKNYAESFKLLQQYGPWNNGWYNYPTRELKVHNSRPPDILGLMRALITFTRYEAYFYNRRVTFKIASPESLYHHRLLKSLIHPDDLDIKYLGYFYIPGDSTIEKIASEYYTDTHI